MDFIIVKLKIGMETQLVHLIKNHTLLSFSKPHKLSSPQINQLHPLCIARKSPSIHKILHQASFVTNEFSATDFFIAAIYPAKKKN
jgi:hypothetical protein